MATTTPEATDRSTALPTREFTGWMGVIAFAGVTMMIAGALSTVVGLVAVLNSDWVVWSNQGSLLIDLTAWGWVHLAVGVVVLLSGIGVIVGNVLARVVGVIGAGVMIAVNFAFMPAYPGWALIMIALSLLVIWSLVVHDRDMKI